MSDALGGIVLHQMPSSGCPVHIPCLHSSRETSICRSRVCNVRRVESVPLVTWSQKRWHLLLEAIITGWLSLDWGQAAVSAGCGQVRGWSQWNSVWSPVSLLGLYSSLRLPHPLHPAVLWSGVLSFPGTWGSPGGNISGGPHTDSGFASKYEELESF